MSDTSVAVPTSPEGAMYRIGSFRPSDRRALLELVRTDGGDDAFVEAIQMFLKKWAEADWIEAYNIERVAKWCALKLPRPIAERLQTTLTTTRLVQIGGQDAYGIFLDELARNVGASQEARQAAPG